MGLEKSFKVEPTQKRAQRQPFDKIFRRHIVQKKTLKTEFLTNRHTAKPVEIKRKPKYNHYYIPVKYWDKQKVIPPK